MCPGDVPGTRPHSPPWGVQGRDGGGLFCDALYYINNIYFLISYCN